MLRRWLLRPVLSHLFHMEQSLMQEFDALSSDVTSLIDGVAAAVVILDELKVALDVATTNANGGVTPADVVALDAKIVAARQALAAAVSKDDPTPVVEQPVVEVVEVTPVVEVSESA